MLLQACSARASYTLHWQDNDTSGDEVGFSIERSDAGAAFVQIATVPPAVTTYQDVGATNAIAYAYRVRSFSANGGYSAYTNTVATAPVLSSRLINLSARVFVGSGSEVPVAGFVVTGASPFQLLLRADGPALGGFDVTGALPDPSLCLFDALSAVIAANTGWGNSTVAGPSSSRVMAQAATSSIFDQVYAFPLAAGSLDSALVADVPSGGAFTVQVASASGTTGVGMIELYDTSLGTSASCLSNISARAFVGSGSNIAVVGFSVSGTTPETLLLRGIGPALAQEGISSPLQEPQLVLYDSQGNVIAINAGWCNPPQAGSSTVSAGIAPATAQLMGSVYASPLPANSPDCAMVVTLPPGIYTAQLSGLNGSTGIGLVEAYDVP
jgi:hypothetical protein